MKDSILIIEDDADVAQALRIVCEQCAYTTQVVGGAEAAVAAVQRDAPLCVLLDLGLPDVVTGLSLLNTLRERFGRDLVIIVVTGHTDRDVHQAVWAAGADHLITKPLRGEVLARILEPDAQPMPLPHLDGKAAGSAA